MQNHMLGLWDASEFLGMKFPVMRQAALFGMSFFFGGGLGDGFSHVELASSKLKVNLVTIFEYIHQSSTGVKNFACHHAILKHFWSH